MNWCILGMFLHIRMPKFHTVEATSNVPSSRCSRLPLASFASPTANVELIPRVSLDNCDSMDKIDCSTMREPLPICTKPCQHHHHHHRLQHHQYSDATAVFVFVIMIPLGHCSCIACLHVPLRANMLSNLHGSSNLSSIARASLKHRVSIDDLLLDATDTSVD